MSFDGSQSLSDFKQEPCSPEDIKEILSSLSGIRERSDNNTDVVPTVKGSTSDNQRELLSDWSNHQRANGENN